MNARHAAPWFALTLLLGAGTLTARAESLGSAASSASSGASSAAGSLSDSVQGSSKSSSGETKVADGAYRVIAVAQADKPGHLRLQLRAEPAPSDASAELSLTLPEAAIAPRGLAVGEIVQVRNRSYGLEFARGDAAGHAPFFLALNQATLRELRAHPLSL
ncbi:MAG: hypothetical protein JNJ71_10300 [Rubrivivax sp.]|nr:hypothetical protein [Rubrivivax sp.]